jgi:hypothetical protein
MTTFKFGIDAYLSFDSQGAPTGRTVFCHPDYQYQLARVASELGVADWRKAAQVLFTPGSGTTAVQWLPDFADWIEDNMSSDGLELVLATIRTAFLEFARNGGPPSTYYVRHTEPTTYYALTPEEIDRLKNLPIDQYVLAEDGENLIHAPGGIQ